MQMTRELLEAEIKKLQEQRLLPRIRTHESGIAYLVDGVSEKPIPPGEPVKGPVRIEARLWSTRRRRAAWWEVRNGVPKEVLNEAPFNPVVRCIADLFMWYPPGARWWAEFSDPMVIQGGTEVVNWFAIIQEPLADPIKVFLSEVGRILADDDAGDGRYIVGKQGSLTIFSLPRSYREIAEELRQHDLLAHRYRFFNHAFVPTNIMSMTWRTLRLGFYSEAWGLLRISRWSRKTECFAVSSDHPDETVRLWEDGWFVLRHPFPSDGFVD